MSDKKPVFRYCDAIIKYVVYSPYISKETTSFNSLGRAVEFAFHRGGTVMGEVSYYCVKGHYHKEQFEVMIRVQSDE